MDVREKLVEQAISHFWYGVSHDIFSEPVKTYAKLAIEALEKENGVTVQEWISVKDRLPEDSGCYLVVYRDKYNGSISIAFDMYVKCNIGEWWESEFACDITKQFLWATRLQEQEVTHWMPLPQPPKGE